MSDISKKWADLRAKHGAQAVRDTLALAAESAAHIRASDDVSDGDVHLTSSAQGGFLMEFVSGDGDRRFYLCFRRSDARDLLSWLARWWT